MKKCLLIVPMLLIAVQTFGYDVEDEWHYVTFIDRQMTQGDCPPVSSEGMAGANAVGAFALADSDNEEDRALAREYVQRLWDVQPPTGKWRYYVGMVYFLSLLHVSGNFTLGL